MKDLKPRTCGDCGSTINWGEPCADTHDDPICQQCFTNYNDPEWWRANPDLLRDSGPTPDEPDTPEQAVEDAQEGLFYQPADRWQHDDMEAWMRDQFDTMMGKLSQLPGYYPNCTEPTPTATAWQRDNVAFTMMRKVFTEWADDNLKLQSARRTEFSEKFLFGTYLRHPDTYAKALTALKDRTTDHASSWYAWPTEADPA